MEKKLKRLLEAVEKEVLRKPSRKTLDRLSLLAGFQDWNSFQKSFNGDAKEEVADEATAVTSKPLGTTAKPTTAIAATAEPTTAIAATAETVTGPSESKIKA
ncbi:MAG: hypothetical protein K5683_01930 [Prevotella sp.]|nr:hypothetical protein [Prevotella sp.]